VTIGESGHRSAPQEPTPAPRFREDLLSLLARTTSDFIALPVTEIDAIIGRTLAETGAMFGVDRSYLFRIDGSGARMDNSHEWCAPGISPEIGNLQGIPTEPFEWWMGEMVAGRPIRLESLAELPAHAVSERAILEPQGIQSILVLPVTWRGRVEGFLGFDHVRGSRRWTDEEVRVLRIVASSIAQSFERRRLDERLQLAATVFAHAHEGIFVTDRDERILEVNPTFCEITGYGREEAIGRTPNMLSSGRHGHDFYASMWKSIRDTGHWRGEVWNRRKDGSLYLERLAISAVPGPDGTVEKYVGVFADITRLKEQEERLEQMAYYDALTKLPNRVLLADRMGQALAHVRRSGGMMAVCYMDLDRFKPVNDLHGHSAGDRLLVEMAHRLKGTLRSGDTVARLGGDEFVIILPGLRSRDECDMLVLRILRCVTDPFEVARGAPVTLTASIGVRLVPPDDADPDMLLRQADQALYAAKQEGRGRSHRFDAERDRQVIARREQVSSIADGLRSHEMVLHGQPVIELASGRVRFAEALVRWRRPDHGLLAPGEWMDAIEDHELISRLGEWVLDEALRWCGHWRAEGLCSGVSINVSARELRDPEFPSRVRDALRRHPSIAASDLKLEVLESAALSDMASVTAAMEECMAMGVQFALDDFGTGYSSLAYLKRLPASTVKIDRSFVSNMLRDPGDRAIVTGVVELAKVFGRSSVAEGVETAEHAEALRELGCDMGQGYGLAPPMPAERFEAWARDRREGASYTATPPCSP
jgi:diguanylate cyclase (GGDEF)-like protein/PAS domain S-box-containing protein